jgi:DNA-binding beta-propeller fold protein YncE
MRSLLWCVVLVLLLGSTPVAAQPGPAAPINLRCPGPDLTFDPMTQQIVSVWEDVVRYPITNDDQGPRGVALDASCNLYVADSANHRVAKLSPAGEPLAQWGSDGRGSGQLHRPGAVALDAAGNIYVADSGNDRIVKLSPDGQVVATWGKCSAGVTPCSPSPGDGPAEFFDPEGIAVDGGGNIYVAEANNQRIQKLSPEGKSLALWGTRGAGPGQFDAPWAVTLDAAGNLYVADLNNNRVQKLSPSGAPLFQFGGTRGADAGQLTQPRGVAVVS